MSSVNKIILLGRLGKDPEMRHMEASGQAKTTFSLATSEKYKDREGNKVEETEWHNVVAWGSAAEMLAKYLQKGSLVYIEGKSKTRQYQTQTGETRYITEVIVRDYKFLSSSGQQSARDNSQDNRQDNSQAPIQFPSNNSDNQEDDLPF
jgi:single-strand DNA-binding protein